MTDGEDSRLAGGAIAEGYLVPYRHLPRDDGQDIGIGGRRTTYTFSRRMQSAMSSF